MISTATGDIAGVGLDVFVLDDRGRIEVDYQIRRELTAVERQAREPDSLGSSGSMVLAPAA
jgi:hypothetical protein